MRFSSSLSTGVVTAAVSSEALGQATDSDNGMRFVSAADDAAHLLASNGGGAFLIGIGLLIGCLFATFVLAHRADGRVTRLFQKIESLLGTGGRGDD